MERARETGHRKTWRSSFSLSGKARKIVELLVGKRAARSNSDAVDKIIVSWSTTMNGARILDLARGAFEGRKLLARGS